MSRRLRRIERLFRLRSLERDVAASLLGRAMRVEREADAARALGVAQVTRVEQDYRELLSAEPTVGFIRASNYSRLKLREGVVVAGEALEQASQTTRERREGAVAAARRVRSIEILMARAHAEARRERMRTEQKRIDDVAGRGRSAWKRLSMLAVTGIALASTPLSVGAAGAAGAAGLDKAASLASPALEASFTAVRVRQAELDSRERELADREQSLAELERGVLTRLAELEQLSELVQSRIESWKDAEGGKSISRLSRIYGVMPAERAARLVDSLDLELATQIVAKMKPKQASAVLALLDKERARKMSERIAHPLSMEPAAAPEESR